MNSSIFIVFLIYLFVQTQESFSLETEDILEQGLYRKSDRVVILGKRNFEKRIYAQSHAWLLQFYNSFCGHCKAFSPKFKSLAQEIEPWRNIIQLAVVDCAVEENSDICRQFEVLVYPSLRYLHEYYVKGNSNLGEQLQITDTAEKLKVQLINKMQKEQTHNALPQLSPFSITAYGTYQSAIENIPKNVLYTFLVFESENSTVGLELILFLNEYENVKVKRVYSNSELAETAGIKEFPGVVAIDPTLTPYIMNPPNPTTKTLLSAINTFLKSKNYVIPIHETTTNNRAEAQSNLKDLIYDDVIYYSDLEKTIKNTLHTEVVRYKILDGAVLQALLDYLDVLIINFPFKGNGKFYFTDLRSRIALQSQWRGGALYELITALEHDYAPVYHANTDYIACRGSNPKYRGYTCGLWTLFHTLTVNAATKPGVEGPKVLKALHGYVKNFFGCTECSQHFQEMAENKKLFYVKENEEAVLWLWSAHNEVNLRLAGDVTEDPAFPKIQFPKADRCKRCRYLKGPWNRSAVYDYLHVMYGAEKIKEVSSAASPATPSPFSFVDYGMLSLLYPNIRNEHMW